MRWASILCVYSHCLLFASAAGEAHSIQEQISDQLVKFLYGNQWSLSEYCNDTRNVEIILRDDVRFGQLYNGSLFESPSAVSPQEVLYEAQIIAARSRGKLSALCSVNSWGYADRSLEWHSNRPHENESQCINEIDKFAEFVENLASWNKAEANEYVKRVGKFSYHHWQQFNTFGRLQSGPTFTNDLLPGDYDGCMQLPGTRYCSGAYGKALRDGDTGEDRVAPFKVGLCLPRSCSDRILQESSRSMQRVNMIVEENLLPASISVRHGLALQDVHCPPLKDSPWLNELARLDLVALILQYHVPLIWLSMLTLGTLCSFANMRETTFARKFMKPFDLRSNWKSFWKRDHLDPKLAGLNGAKVICMNWLFMSHISLSMNAYLRDMSKVRPHTWHGAIVLQGQHGVPLFFIISGLLTGLRYLKKRELSFREMLVSRYLRLLPMYLVIYAYVKKFAHLTNDGPFWDYGVSAQSEARQCMNESWLVPILMLANFTPPFAHCIITGWHIANDFQIFLVLPLLFWVYRKCIPLGRAVVIVTFLVTHLSHVWQWGAAQNFTYYSVAAEPALFGPRIVLDRVALDYVNPLGRLGTYFLGVLVADLLLANGRYFKANQAARRVTFGAHEKQQSSRDGPASKHVTGSTEEESEPALDESDGIRLTTLVALAKQQHAGDHHHHQAPARDHQQLADINGNSSSFSNDNTQENPNQLRLGEELRRLKYHQLISSLRDNALLLFGMQAAYGSLFTVIWPTSLKLLFEPYSKAVAYPWVRMNVELGWAICLYYLLRDNCAQRQPGGPDDTAARLSASGQERALARAKTKLALVDDHHDDDGQARGGKVFKNSHNSLKSTATGHSEETKSTNGKYELTFGGFLLKYRFWNVLVKLNYTLMLLHYSVVRYFVQSQRQLLIFTWTNYFQLATFIILLTYVLCFIVHLAIEMPLMALTKLLIVKLTSRSR